MKITKVSAALRKLLPHIHQLNYRLSAALPCSFVKEGIF